MSPLINYNHPLLSWKSHEEETQNGTKPSHVHILKCSTNFRDHKESLPLAVMPFFQG